MNIQDAFTQATLAFAAYADLQRGDLTAQQTKLQDVGMSPVQAVQFSSNWLVVDQYSNAFTGLSATVFQEVATGKRYLAIRGTDGPLDLVTDLVNIAVIGTPLLQPQYLLLRAKVQGGRRGQAFTL